MVSFTLNNSGRMISFPVYRRGNWENVKSIDKYLVKKKSQSDSVKICTQAF